MTSLALAGCGSKDQRPPEAPTSPSQKADGASCKNEWITVADTGASDSLKTLRKGRFNLTRMVMHVTTGKGDSFTVEANEFTDFALHAHCSAVGPETDLTTSLSSATEINLKSMLPSNLVRQMNVTYKAGQLAAGRATPVQNENREPLKFDAIPKGRVQTGPSTYTTISIEPAGEFQFSISLKIEKPDLTQSGMFTYRLY